MINPDDYIVSDGEGADKKIGVKWGALATTIFAWLIAGNFVGIIDFVRGIGRGFAQTVEGVGRWVEHDLIGGLLTIPLDSYRVVWDSHANWIASTFGPFALVAIAVETIVLGYLFALGIVFLYNAVLGGLG
jgi:hypothetical protein